MGNIVLYRKYRPQTFGEIVGQGQIVQTLKNAVAGNLLSHAYLFTGPRGAGKTTMARLLAKAANCERPKKGEPCNTCMSCTLIQGNKTMDIIELDAASHRGIEEVRDIKEGVRFAPTNLKYKVYVIDEAHQLTREAANALLKTLEEPPAHAIFILATTEAHKMIPTIASRCQIFPFRKLKTGEIIRRLSDLATREKVEAEEGALALIAASSGGSFRDAESLLDKVLTFGTGSARKKLTVDTVQDLLGLVDLNIVSAFVDLLIAGDAGKTLWYFHEQLEQGVDPYEFVLRLVSYLRTMILLKVHEGLEVDETFTPEQEERLRKQATAMDALRLSTAIRQFMEATEKMKTSSIVQLPLELAVLDTLQE